MKSFILLIIFVLQNVLITINTEKTSMLGISPCMYSGDFDPYGFYCPPDPMSLELIPKECTSLVYDGLIYNGDNTYNFSGNDGKNILALGSSDKLFYLHYGYESPEAWNVALKCGNVIAEADRLNTFLSGLNVKGLILKNLNIDYNSNSDFHYDTFFYDRLKSYVSTMTKLIPNLYIGLYVNARNMIFYKDNPTSPDYFNFKVLNDVMNYYIIGFDKFNLCNDIYKGGIVPLNDILHNNDSLRSFASALSYSTIAKENIYLEFMASPTPNDTTIESLPKCCVTYQKYCEDDHYNNFWCADTSDSFYEKGKFAKEIKAQGFVTKYIDTIDPTAKCDCDYKNRFVTFSMMRRGFLGLDPITDCIKLNNVTL